MNSMSFTEDTAPFYAWFSYILYKQESSCPSVSVGDWLQGPRGYENPRLSGALKNTVQDLHIGCGRVCPHPLHSHGFSIGPVRGKFKLCFLEFPDIVFSSDFRSVVD